MALALRRQERKAPVVVLDDRAYWRRPAPGRRARDEGQRPEAPPARQPVRAVPRQGWLVRDGGRAASLPQPAVWRATTASAAGIYPWLVAEPLPAAGAAIGYDVFSRSTFCSHPVEWLRRGVTTNPNVLLTALPGAGKSALIKQHILRLAPFGVKSLVLGDIKGEYNDLARFLGVRPIVLGPGFSDRLNPLDGGPLAKSLPTDHRKRAERLAEVHRRRLTLLQALVSYRLSRPVTTVEEAALSLALARATGEDRGGVLRDPEVAEVLSCLWEMGDADAGPSRCAPGRRWSKRSARPASPCTTCSPTPSRGFSTAPPVPRSTSRRRSRPSTSPDWRAGATRRWPWCSRA